MSKIAAFDVFDTTLTRTVGQRAAAFLLLGRYLRNRSLTHWSADAFARARLDAEFRASKNTGGLDSKLTLPKIYEELGSAMMLTEEQCDEFIKLERTLEEELIRPVPVTRKWLQDARTCGERVVFLSDMYLPAKFIQKQLERHNLWVEGDTCYVSCEYGKSKASGNLFRELLAREGVSPNSVSYCGNNQKADVEAPKRLGLRVKPFLEGNLNRYEEILESYVWATEGLSSAMAGASRLARLTVPATSPREKALRDVAAGVAAPMLVGYVLWVLQQAQRQDLKRLYFISRDGQILLEIARKLAGKLNVTCEFRYLYGSRLSWNLPAINSIDEHWIWAPAVEGLAVRSVLARVSIDPEEVSDTLVSAGFKKGDWSRILSSDELSGLRSVVQKSSIRGLIFQKASQRRRVLNKYFEQEGLLDSTDKGIVDLGWHGTMHNSLAVLLASAGGKPPPGFYFAITGGPKNDLREAYMFDVRFSRGFIEPWIPIIIEPFCVADHGSVLDFKEEGERIRPVLKGEFNQLVIDWGLPLFRKTVDSFVEHLSLNPSLTNLSADMRPASVRLLNTFWFNPSSAEATTWSRLPWEDNQGNNTAWSYLAGPYRWKHVAEAVLNREMPRHNRCTWVAGSIAVSSPAIRISLKTLRLIRQAARRMIESTKDLINVFLVWDKTQ